MDDLRRGKFTLPWKGFARSVAKRSRVSGRSAIVARPAAPERTISGMQRSVAKIASNATARRSVVPPPRSPASHPAKKNRLPRYDEWQH